MGIGERIKEERERLEFIQAEFAALGDASKNSQVSWEKGTAFPNAKVLSAWADAGADVGYIISGCRLKEQNSVRENAERALQPQIVAEPSKQACADEFIHVPKYEVQASAGNGSLVHDESVVDHLAFKRDWAVRTLGLDPKRLALIDVAGDSMSPTINDGDLILLDTRPGQLRTEGIYVINLGGALLVKRIRMRLSGAVDVVSDNERYGTETISGEQLTSLQIVGRVVWQGRRV